MRGSRSFSHMMSNFSSIPLAVVGLTEGLATVIGAFMLDYRIAKRRNWALLILAGSIVGIISGSISGLYIESILEIVGGVLAFFWSPLYPRAHEIRISSQGPPLFLENRFLQSGQPAARCY